MWKTVESDALQALWHDGHKHIQNYAAVLCVAEVCRDAKEADQKKTRKKGDGAAASAASVSNEQHGPQAPATPGPAPVRLDHTFKGMRAVGKAVMQSTLPSSLIEVQSENAVACLGLYASYVWFQALEGPLPCTAVVLKLLYQAGHWVASTTVEAKGSPGFHHRSAMLFSAVTP